MLKTHPCTTCDREPSRLPKRGMMAAFAVSAFTPILFAQAAPPDGMVTGMLAAETAAKARHTRFAFVSEERSTRTGGHLWQEHVVETDNGDLRLLTAVDGVPLAPAAEEAEWQKIQRLIAHPDELRKAGHGSDDEQRKTDLLAVIPRASVFTPLSTQDGCAVYKFAPNPAFHPASSEEKIIAAMGGTMGIEETSKRLCFVKAEIVQPVQFGFGILGHVNQGGKVAIERKPVDATHWQLTHISLHVDGKLLMVKNLSRDMEQTTTATRLLPPHLGLEESSHLLR